MLNSPTSPSSATPGEIFELAKRVFGDTELADKWFDSPALALEHQNPRALLTTPQGRQAVELILRRIEYGVYT